MNPEIIKVYISEYKREFSRINRDEIYKWKAIKHFQEHFDLEAPDLASNIEFSMDEAKNLLASGQYWPKRMLRKNAELAPDRVREMLRILFDEDFDLGERIESFRADFKILNQENFGDDNDYQDHRALLVYLVLMYPERYFLYKFGMFKEFARLVEYPYQPKIGKVDNLGHYLSLCDLVKEYIEKDQELLSMHARRLDDSCYRDIEYHVLTQDFIYAVVRHLKEQSIEVDREPQFSAINFSINDSEDFNLKNTDPSFKGSTVNYIQNDIENKRTGDAGELWVLNYEKAYLINQGKPNLAKKIRHVSKDVGDGLGYDILSYSLDGSEKYIEVKTTKASFYKTFYVTNNELEWSKRNPDQYYLYRLYEFKDSSSQAKLQMIKGDLSSICQIPVSFKVDLESQS
ncbi:DUF3883 domain-containing protein [Belliella sp. DSM 107340]|uniref:DUF3883 domain-containing protein n=1 Tax=Belliella calami TaxID=2923436 RepID=A0ABS9UJD4_9BACT|nr:DUF3883 domain-containing protein [Belliella calami]MCH7396737.1 DUF3883 domain-containing protein [Belliella calami]